MLRIVNWENFPCFDVLDREVKLVDFIQITLDFHSISILSLSLVFKISDRSKVVSEPRSTAGEA